MRRTFTYFIAAVAFCVLMLTLSLSFNTRTARAGDINERCNECTRKMAEAYEKCVARYPNPEDQMRCDEEFNRDVIHCYKNFCEQ